MPKNMKTKGFKKSRNVARFKYRVELPKNFSETDAETNKVELRNNLELGYLKQT